MTLLVDNSAARLAGCIQAEREARHWSQAELAGRSGLSRAAIGKIERAEISPTAATLVRLAGAFDLTLAGLLLRAEGSGERLMRRAEQPQWRDPETGYLRQQIFMRPDHPVELVEVELPPRTQVSLPASSYARIRQVVWVRSGRLNVQEGAQMTELHEGDSLGFGLPADVVLSNPTAEPCRYLVALARS